MLRPKLVLDGRFEVEALVAVGGQAEVYRGVSLSDGRRLALKLMRDMDGVDTAEARRQFIREWEVIKQPARHLPAGFALLEHQGRPVIVEEWLDGHSLVDEGTHLPVERAAHVALALLEALEDLHARRPAVVVRDIKPQNTLVDGDRVWLADLSGSRPDRGFRDTIQLGTPGFAAPEQYQGRSSPRSDLFSVGVLLHYLLTGQDTMGITLPCCPQPLRPDVSSAVDAVVRRATQLDPDARYAAARDMAADLRRALKAPSLPPASWPAPHPAPAATAAPPRGRPRPPVPVRRVRGWMLFGFLLWMTGGWLTQPAHQSSRWAPPTHPRVAYHNPPLHLVWTPSRAIPPPRSGWSDGGTSTIGFEASSVHEPQLFAPPPLQVARWLPLPAGAFLLRLLPGRLALIRRTPPALALWDVHTGRRVVRRAIPGRTVLAAADRPAAPRASVLVVSTDIALQAFDPADARPLGIHSYARGEALVGMLPASDRGWSMDAPRAGTLPRSPLVGGISRDRQLRVYDMRGRLIYRSAAVAPDDPAADGLTGSGHRIVMSSPSGTWCWRVDDATWIPFQPGEPGARVAHDRQGRMLIVTRHFVATRDWQGYVHGWSTGFHPHASAVADRDVGGGVDDQFLVADGDALYGYNLRHGALSPAFRCPCGGRIVALGVAPSKEALAVAVTERGGSVATVDLGGRVALLRAFRFPAGFHPGPFVDAELDADGAALLFRRGVFVLGGPGTWRFAPW